MEKNVKKLNCNNFQQNCGAGYPRQMTQKPTSIARRIEAIDALTAIAEKIDALTFKLRQKICKTFVVIKLLLRTEQSFRLRQPFWSGLRVCADKGRKANRMSTAHLPELRGRMPTPGFVPIRDLSRVHLHKI